MTGCAAINCSNSTEKGFRLFRFPKDEKRRAVWVQNTRRGGGWKPTDNSCLCEVHFEPNQLEQHRQDGVIKPKPNAVPTIFNIPNCPKSVTMKRALPNRQANIETIQIHPAKRRRAERDEENLEMATESETSTASDNETQTITALKNEIERLKKKVANREERLKNLEKNLEDLFSPDQMDYLKLKGTQSTRNVLWLEGTIEKSLQLRCAIGKRGYEYLRGQGFPFPSYRTLCRKIEGMLFQEGIHFEFLDCLKYKLEESERDCVLLLDEMQICEKITYDTSLKMFAGLISKDMQDDDADKLASHVLIFMLRGVRHNWKQPVAHYFTGPSINGKKLASVIENILKETHSRGINVIAVVSDMGSNNRSMWNVFGVHSIRNHVSKTITHPSDPLKKVYFLPDVPHILKNVRNCLLKQDIIFT